MIAIIDYGAGNLKSVERALQHLGVVCRITSTPEDILSADRVIFPGVGAAASAMETIRSRGLDAVIHEAVREKTPFLGICLGAQIVLEQSEEDGDTPCLGIIAGRARRFPDSNLKIPHMGWNDISVVRSHPLLQGVDRRAQFYFVHSFYPDPSLPDDRIAATAYGIEFTSIAGKGNVVVTQFHPEKSGPPGLRMLKNFSEWNGMP